MVTNAKAELEKTVRSQQAEIESLTTELRSKGEAVGALQSEVAGLRERQAALSRQADEAQAAMAEAQKKAADAEERATRLANAAGVPTTDMVLSAEVTQARFRLSTAERQVRGWRGWKTRGGGGGDTGAGAKCGCGGE